MKITKGIQQVATKGVLHGPPGVGKTTLAASMPNPLILDTEKGARRIDCHRVEVGDWMTLKGTLVELARESMGYRTIVVDSADWAEELLCLYLATKDEKQRHPDDLPYGQGGVLIAKHFSAMLADCSVLVERGINVVFVAHSVVKRVSPPDLEEAYDRYELKLRPKVAPKLLEWADAVLFANFKTRVVEGEDGKLRGRGGKERRLFCERSAAWDAKNRFGLPPELPMTIEALAPLFADAPAPASTPKPKGWRERIAEAATIEEIHTIQVAVNVALDNGKLTQDQFNTLCDLLDERADSLTPEDVHHDAPAGA